MIDTLIVICTWALALLAVYCAWLAYARRRTIAALLGILEARDAEIRTLTRERDSLNTQWQEVARERCAAVAERDKAQDDRNTTRALVDNLNRQVAKRDKTIAELDRAGHNALDECVDNKGRNTELERRIIALQAQVSKPRWRVVREDGKWWADNGFGTRYQLSSREDAREECRKRNATR